jgi:LacI family transcriptional regulator
MVTSRDVARVAGVSQATVSRVLHNNPNVGEDIRLRVLKAFEDTGYVANTQARAMRTRRTGIIGVVTGQITNPFYPELIDALATSLNETGQRMILWTTGGSSEPGAVDAIRSGAVDGVIFTTATGESEALNEAIRRRAPLVLTNRSIAGAPCDQVTSDNVTGGGTIANYFLSYGHTNVAVVGGPETISTGRERQAGFVAALEEAGVRIPLRRTPAAATFLHEAGMEIGMKLLRARDRPTAIFCVNDLLAFGVLDAARRLGIGVPDDLWVAGYDDVEMASWPSFDLTTVRQPTDAMAKVVVAMLLRRISSDAPLPFEHRRFVSELVVRSSTGAKPESVPAEWDVPRRRTPGAG